MTATSSGSTPYKLSPVFNETTLPAAFRRAHSIKPGSWGVIRVLQGELRYVIEESAAQAILSPERPGLVQPQQLHHVEPVGPMQMQLEFYDHEPKHIPGLVIQ